MAAPMVKTKNLLKIVKCKRFSLFNTTYLATSSAICLRNASTSTSKGTVKDNDNKGTPPPSAVQGDCIGLADPVSNIRHMRFHIPEDETATEREFREKRDAVQQWSHDFWCQHNTSFLQQKEAFIMERLAQKGDTTDSDSATQTLSAEEMSEFYKKFLDTNYKLHTQYNVAWYKKSVSLLWPAIKAAVVSTKRDLMKRKKT